MWETAIESKKVCTVEYSYDWVFIGSVESAGKTELTYEMTNIRTISRTDLQSKSEGIGRSIAAGIESSLGVSAAGLEASIAASVSEAMSQSLNFEQSVAYTGEISAQSAGRATLNVEDGYYGILNGCQLIATIRYFEYYAPHGSSGQPRINDFGSIKIPLNNFGYRSFIYE